MKKTITLLLAFVMIFSFASCKSNADIKNSDGDATDEVTTTAKEETEKSPIYDKAYYDFEKRLYIVENAEPKEQYFYQNGGDLHGGTLSYSSVDEALEKCKNDENSAGFFLFKAQKLSSKSICHMDAWISAAFAPCYTVTTVKILEIYGEFPRNTDFKYPKHVPNGVRWARFRMESAMRLVGFFVSEDSAENQSLSTDVFYIVFLDKDHRFYKMESK